MTTYKAPVEDMMFLFNELLDNKHFKEINQYKDNISKKDTKYHLHKNIRLNNICFSYKDRSPLLENINI